MGETTRTHAPEVRRIGPGAYRAECLLRTGDDEQHIGCGWIGDLHEGQWWASKAAAEADADQHVGRPARPAAKGPTPSRPVRIADELWAGVLAVSLAENVTASEVLRSAIAAYPPVAGAITELAKAN